jgi:hypothetical protein
VVHESTSLSKDPHVPLRAAYEERFLDRDPVQVALELLGRLAPGTTSAAKVIDALTEVVESGHPQ